LCIFVEKGGIDCEPEDFMGFRDAAEYGAVVIAPDGRKYKYTAEQLDAAEIEMQPAPKPKAPAKRRTRTKKAAAKKVVKTPAKKAGTKE